MKSEIKDHKKEIQAISLKMPRGLYLRLRKAAFDGELKMSHVVLKLIRDHLDNLEENLQKKNSLDNG